MKLLKKDTKPFLNVLYKLTDNRFKFNIVRSAEKIVNKLKSDFVYSFIISNIQYAFIYDAINSEA